MLNSLTDYYHCQLLILYKARDLSIPSTSLEYSVRKSMHEVISLRGLKCVS